MEQAESSTFLKVAEIEVNDVRPDQSGFTLLGRGADRSDYRLEWHLDMPMDARTKSVLGGLLAQSEFRVWRRASEPRGTRRANRTRHAEPSEG